MNINHNPALVQSLAAAMRRRELESPRSDQSRLFEVNILDDGYDDDELFDGNELDELTLQSLPVTPVASQWEMFQDPERLVRDYTFDEQSELLSFLEFAFEVREHNTPFTMMRLKMDVFSGAYILTVEINREGGSVGEGERLLTQLLDEGADLDFEELEEESYELLRSYGLEDEDFDFRR